MDQGIIETTGKLYRKALMLRNRTAYDASKRYNVNLLSATYFLNSSWQELASSKVTNCFANASFFITVVSGPDDDQPEHDRTRNDLYEAVH
ncbi:hypothetical protein HPB48_006931 [Haemaphysalis longicornis]|uniref:Uncharacterized protein n=1 Tax=Haemaphysalis longicornis TaxID=44386 RepID=A0A9J6GF41_HAELO|nr:hypothetical protein HPB48_006931 [Haemaphysalis longicornis]